MSTAEAVGWAFKLLDMGIEASVITAKVQEAERAGKNGGEVLKQMVADARKAARTAVLGDA
jgi:hypothetical protein